MIRTVATFGKSITDHDYNVIVPVALQLAKEGFFEVFDSIRTEVSGKFCQEIQGRLAFVLNLFCWTAVANTSAEAEN